MNKTWISTFGIILSTFTAAAWTAPVPVTGQIKGYDAAGNVITSNLSGRTILYSRSDTYVIDTPSYTKLDG